MTCSVVMRSLKSTSNSLALWKEPVDIPARATDQTDARRRRPLYIEKAGNPGVQLSLTPPERLVVAHLAPQRPSLHVDGFRFAFVKHRHGLSWATRSRLTDPKRRRTPNRRSSPAAGHHAPAAHPVPSASWILLSWAGEPNGLTFAAHPRPMRPPHVAYWCGFS